MTYGQTREDAISNTERLAIEVIRRSDQARRVFAALERIGWRVKRQSGSHRLPARGNWPDYKFAFHDNDELSRKMLSRIAEHTGLQPKDL
ncbi:MAG TPA: type II toxin-antitoxin system HicA family toxin [Bryobacteraceae bacterium]|nr:type II toxin-antitoxin system HicA family toxin [Bryobacteraceae bacterium]